jgi:hypothetical protein
VLDTQFFFAVSALAIAVFMFSSMVIGLLVEAVRYEKDKRKKLSPKRVKDQP